MKDLAGVKGTIAFQDLFDDEIKRVGFSYDDGLRAGKTATWSGSLDYNQFMDSDVKLRNTPLEKMTVRWEPEVLIYTDGAKLRLPQ